MLGVYFCFCNMHKKMKLNELIFLSSTTTACEGFDLVFSDNINIFMLN